MAPSAIIRRVKIFRFEGPHPDLELLPLAARRALDRAGIKLSLESFRSLPKPWRERLVELGSVGEVPLDVVHNLLADAPHLRIPEEPELSPYAVSAVIAELGGPIPSPKVWQSLTPLERYALAKTAARGLARQDPTRYHEAYLEIVGATDVSTHLDAQGAARMVDVTPKDSTYRRAMAESFVTMSSDAFSRLTHNDLPKGNVLEVARLAGIMATKRTSDLIPLCHPLALTHAAVSFTLEPERCQVRIMCETAVTGPTGVEMEACVGASIAGLTIYDMLKGIDRSMTLGPTRLLHKEGGQSGTFVRTGS
jgi:cyclic pyranopterin monophosphate synthase